MAALGSAALLTRIKSLIPAGWFAYGEARVRDAVLGGVSDGLALSTADIEDGRAQTRLLTATGAWLDLAAWDLFGTRFTRRPGEGDEAFRARILPEVLRPRATRAAIAQAVSDLTGHVPDIYEPWNPGDCGAYDVGTLAYAGDGGPPPALQGTDMAGGAYDLGLAYRDPEPFVPASPGAGIWGDDRLRNQIFVRVRRGQTRFEGIDGVGAYDVGTLAYGGGDPIASRFAGYDTSAGGLDVGPLGYFTPDLPNSGFPGVGAIGPSIAFDITDEEIFETVAATKAAGVIAWTAIDPV